MSEKKKKNEYTERPKAEYWNPKLCSACGNNDFTWGKIGGAFFYKKGFLNSLFPKSLEARQCKRCGKIELFAEQANG